MNRREFLNLSWKTTAAFALAPWVGIRDTTVAEGAPLQAGTIGNYLVQFAAMTGSVQVSQAVIPWVNQMEDDDRIQAQRLNAYMANLGYGNLFSSPVFVNTTVFFYGALAPLGNCCAPFFHRKQYSLVEGPIIIGLAAAAKDWDDACGVSVAHGLVPIRGCGGCRADFHTSLPAPLSYQTRNGGHLDIGYKVTNAPRDPTTDITQATISVVASRDNGGVLFGKDYDITYNPMGTGFIQGRVMRI